MKGINCDFDSVDHVYTQDCVVIPSVTQVLDETGIVDYDGVPKRYMDHASERGHYVDACCRAYDAGDLDESRVNPEAQGYVAAFKNFKADRGFKTHSWGKPRVAVLNGQRFGMTEDLTGWMDAKPWLIDVKCTAKLEDSVRVQTAAYASGLGRVVVSDSGIETYDFIRSAVVNVTDPMKVKTVSWNRAALQLFPDATYKLDPHTDDEADHMEWRCALYLVTRRNNRRG